MDVYSADWVLPVEGPPIPHGAVAVEDGLIAAVDTAAELGAGESHPGCVILPGFVNAHSHLEYAAYGGFGDGLRFREWLADHIARKARLGWDDHVAIARLGAAESLCSGITTTGDACFTGAAALALAELGLRGIVYLEVFGADERDLAARFEPNRERIEASLSDRVRLGISPHAPYTASTALYAACLGLELPIVTHLAESTAEREWLVDGSGAFAADPSLLVPPTGTTGARALAGAGLLSDRLVAVHCVTLDAEEIDLLAEHGVAVAHCPRSNAFLGCGVAPVDELLAAGVRVGLGTDSPATAPSIDMFAEMRAALAHARARAEDPGALDADTVLELATLGSATALGLADEVGSLRAGKRADICVLDLTGTPFEPVEHPAVAVVLGGTPWCVSRTIVGGITRYSRGGPEWHELRRSAAGARGRMLALRSA